MGTSITPGRSARFRRRSWWSWGARRRYQTCHSAALGVSVGRLAELGVEIKPALDRQTVAGLGGLDDITDIGAWVVCLMYPDEWDRRAAAAHHRADVGAVLE